MEIRIQFQYHYHYVLRVKFQANEMGILQSPSNVIMPIRGIISRAGLCPSLPQTSPACYKYMFFFFLFLLFRCMELFVAMGYLKNQSCRSIVKRKGVLTSQQENRIKA